VLGNVVLSLTLYKKLNLLNKIKIFFQKSLAFILYDFLNVTISEKCSMKILIFLYFTFLYPLLVKGYTRFVAKSVTDRRKCFRPHNIYIFLIRITSRVDLGMPVCPYVRWDLENYQRYRVPISYLDSVPLNAAQVCYANIQAAQTCGAHNKCQRLLSY